MLAGEVSSIKGNEKADGAKKPENRGRLAGHRFRHHPFGRVILGAEARRRGGCPEEVSGFR